MATYIDLTAAGDPAVPAARVHFESISRIDEKGYNITRIVTDSHAGTHMDAPLHMVAGGGSIDLIPVSACCRLADVIDVRDRAGRAIGPSELAPHTERITGERAVILWTGWESRWGTPGFREGAPFVNEDGARWLLERGVDFIGMDLPSVGPLDDHERLVAVHQILLRRGVIIVECLVNLSALPQTVELIALPLKLKGVDGSPVRAVARY